ncbi:hypothetical protein [Rhodococcus sp. NCIMB 12038]|uniref:hypothetical protein n=1 Tax=Rhodococcus sp. NCIMB 12038 TaxID=933800 RepID=UPI0015C68179|nr:hypothetical protein [Rhodococcus sp. NCIMB 12038]
MLTNPMRFDLLASSLDYVKADSIGTVAECRLVAREAPAIAWDERHRFARIRGGA